MEKEEFSCAGKLVFAGTVEMSDCIVSTHDASLAEVVMFMHKIFPTGNSANEGR